MKAKTGITEFEVKQVAYTASILACVAISTGRSVAETAAAVGASGISRLIHNAPMNQLLPANQIVGEIVHEYHLPAMLSRPPEPDPAAWEKISSRVASIAKTKNELGEGLLSALTNEYQIHTP